MNNKSGGILKVLLVSCCFALAFAACKKSDNTSISDFEYNYYPTDSGHYIIYDVDSILYSYNGNHNNDTQHYQAMMVVADTTYDNLNQLTYVLEWYRRADSNSSWNFDRRWYAQRTTTNMQVFEDDNRFIKLVFPPSRGEKWNGNLYVSTTAQYTVFQNWNYNYQNIDTPYTLNGQTFNATAVVSEVDVSNLIKKTLRREVYAKGVGMIYQEWEDLSKQDVNADWNTGPENGFRIRMRLWAYH